MRGIEQAIEVLQSFDRCVKVKADGAYETNEFIKARNLAIAALEAQQADMWIPITEDESTYPESFTEVIFTDGDCIYIGCCDPDYEWSSTNQEDSIQIEAVTAWKPLPTPYKEEA